VRNVHRGRDRLQDHVSINVPVDHIRGQVHVRGETVIVNEKMKCHEKFAMIAEVLISAIDDESLGKSSDSKKI